jgi:hypothetical protein
LATTKNMNWERQYIIDSSGLIQWDEAMRVSDQQLLEAMRSNKLVHDIACNFAYMGVRTGIA